MDEDKELFLQEFGESYGYPNAPKTIDQIRATEFKRLDGKFLFFSFSRTNFYLFLLLFFWNETFSVAKQSDWWRLFIYLFFTFLGLVYLDHAGATLYSESQMEAVCKNLTATVYGNPRILLFRTFNGFFLLLELCLRKLFYTWKFTLFILREKKKIFLYLEILGKLIPVIWP